MADGQGQGQAPQFDTGEPRPSVETARGQGPPEQGGGDPGHAAHWCYQCNKEVVVEPEQDGVPGSMVCGECQSGFVEALATAQTVPDVRRAQRRRRRRGTTAAAVVAGTSPGAAAAARNIVPLSEALEHLYPQQLMQVLQMLGQATNRSNSPAPGTQGQENAGTVQPRNTAVESQTPVPVEDATATASQTTVQDLPAGEVRIEGQEGRVERPEGEDRAATPAATAEALERLTQEGHMLFISGASPGNEEDADEDLVVSDTESEEGMRLEFDAWDSADEDEEEWEEVDEDEEAAATGEEGGAGEEHETEPQEGEQPEEQQGEERPHRREFRLRTRNMEHNLHQYLQELLQNLVGQNVEVRVEMPNGPLYVGNPGDYVDARGFEQLLQQMAENDNSRRGAPPAAKTAVDRLPSISIEQRHLEDGSAVCAICKDVVALGEPAKQLPCFHLYHNDCILPWLGSRNSCPVCRYELPTDDPDYEEQKQSRNGTVQNTSSQSPSSGAEVAEGQDNSNVGGNVVQNTPGQDQDATDANVEAGQMLGASTSETYVQQVVSAGGEQEHTQSASDRSLLPGPDTANTNPLRSSNEEGGENVRGENESDEIGRGEALRGTGRGWFLLAAAPVLSMMGLVLVLCLGNHFMGGRMNHLRTPLQRQQHHFFQEPHVEQIGGSSDVQGRRRWWMPFQR